MERQKIYEIGKEKGVEDLNTLKCQCGESIQYQFEKRFFCINCDKEVQQ